MTLTLTDVTLTYPDADDRVTALDSVDLHVPAGTLTAVTGPSGSGKSSLLAVAAALVTPDGGEVVIDGVSTTGLSRSGLTALRGARVGVVYQQPNLIASLTAAEQLEVAARVTGRRAGGRVNGLLETVGLADRARHRPHQLSGGQRQRVNIARALVNSPAVLLVDEPTSALDRDRGAAVINLLVTITRQRGVATVLVTHDPTHLSAADTVLTLTDGRLTEPGR